MRGLMLLLVIIGVAATRAQVDQCTTEQATNWSVEKLLRHEDCHKFYQCTLGKPVESTCPVGLYFNLETWECDWAYNVDCKDRVNPAQTTAAPETPIFELTTPESTIPESTTPEPASLEPSELDSSETLECVVDIWPVPVPPKEVETVDNGCPVDPQVHWLLPHAEDCSLFFYCVWGELVASECPDALHFNPKLQVCDRPADAGCTVSANKHAEARRRLLNQILG